MVKVRSVQPVDYFGHKAVDSDGQFRLTLIFWTGNFGPKQPLALSSAVAGGIINETNFSTFYQAKEKQARLPGTQ